LGTSSEIIYIPGSGTYVGTWGQLSDYRIKEYVRELDETYIVDNLRPVTYKHKLTQKQDMGLIAHEVQEEYPFLVNGEKDGKDYQSVNYIGLIPLLIKEIQDLKKEVSSLKKLIQNPP